MPRTPWQSYPAMVAHLQNQFKTTQIGMENKRQTCATPCENKNKGVLKQHPNNSSYSVNIYPAIYLAVQCSKCTSWIQYWQVLRAADWLCSTRLVHSTLHLAALLPLCGAQSVVASGPEGPIQVLMNCWRVREDSSILKPGHGDLVRVETVHITIKSDRDVVSLPWQSRQSNRWGIWQDRGSHTEM